MFLSDVHKYSRMGCDKGYRGGENETNLITPCPCTQLNYCVDGNMTLERSRQVTSIQMFQPPVLDSGNFVWTSHFKGYRYTSDMPNLINTLHGSSC